MLRAARVQEYCLGYIELGARLTSFCHKGNLCHSLGEVYWWGFIAPFKEGEGFHPYMQTRLEFESFQVYPALENMLQEGDHRGKCLEEADSRIGDSREPV